MKTLKLAVALFILSGLGCLSADANAQTVTSAKYNTPESIVIQSSCLNLNRGLTLTLSGKGFEIYHYKVINGLETGTWSYVTNQFAGVGSNGVSYTAYGNRDMEFADFDFNTSDGNYSLTSEFLVTGTKNGVLFERWLVHRTQVYSVTNAGNNFIITTDDSSCK